MLLITEGNGRLQSRRICRLFNIKVTSEPLDAAQKYRNVSLGLFLILRLLRLSWKKQNKTKNVFYVKSASNSKVLCSKNKLS